MKKLLSVLLSLAFSIGYFIVPAGAVNSNLDLELMSRAVPDECFIEMGSNTALSGDECTEGIEKTNQAYVWGMTVSNDRVWFGTGSNVHCLVTGTFLQSTGSTLRTWGNETDYVCELEDGENSALPDSLKDWRAPDLYVQGVNSSNPTPLIPKMSATGKQLAASTLGFRAAGSVGNLVYFGGPSLLGGINIFVFDSQDASFLGATNLPSYSNIRTLKPFRGAMVAGVSSSSGGAALIFDGGREDPLSVTEAFTTTAGEIAEFEFYENRFYFGTWPSLGAEGITEATVRVGPEIGTDLDFGEDGDYQVLWRASDYDPDPVIASTYGIGSMKFFDGQLHFGTMHVPLLSLSAISGYYDDYLADFVDDPAGQLSLFLGSLRSSALFRYDPSGADGDSLAMPETLYGNPVLPRFEVIEGYLEMNLEPNPVSELSIHGSSGFNNPFNNYIWSMAEYDDKLYVGTMDWSYLLLPSIGEIAEGEPNPLAGPEFFNLSGILKDLFDFFQLAIDEVANETIENVALEDLQGITGFLDTEVSEFLEAILAVGIIGDPGLENEIESLLDRIDALTEYVDSLPASPTQEQIDEGFAIAQGIYVDLGEILVGVEAEVIQTSDQLEPLSYGADIMVFDKTNGPAQFLSTDGLGNHLNYGIRTMASHSREGVFFGTANPMNLQQQGGWELYNLGPSYQLFSAPNPFPGPVVTDVGADGVNADYITSSGRNITVLGSNLDLITELEIAGIRFTPDQVSENAISLTLPTGIESGLHELIVYAGAQKISVLERLNVKSTISSQELCSEQGPALWTKRVSDSETKVYIRCAEPGVKYQVLVQNNGTGAYEEVFWTRLESSDQPSQRFVGGYRYFVRSYNIDQKLRIRLVEDGQLVRQVVYNN